MCILIPFTFLYVVLRKVHSIKVIAFEMKVLSPALQMKKCLISRFLKLIKDAIRCIDVAMKVAEGKNVLLFTTKA